MTEKLRQTSSKRLVISLFVIVLLASTAITALPIFTSWLSSAQQMTKAIANDLNTFLTRGIEDLIHSPSHINAANQAVLELGMVDFQDDATRDRYFAGLLASQHDHIFAYTYATADGHLYGARRDAQGAVKILRRDAGTKDATWYYPLEEEAQATEDDIVPRGDPRDRVWFKIATAAGEPALTPVYHDSGLDHFIVSSTWPIYSAQDELMGVLAAHMRISGVQDYLRAAVEDYGGHAFVVEQATGMIVVNTMEWEGLAVLDGNTVSGQAPDARGLDIVREYDIYRTTGNPEFLFKGTGGHLFINAGEIRLPGLNWVVISAIPEQLYLSHVTSSSRMALLSVAVGLLMAMLVFNTGITSFLKPVDDLYRVTQAMVDGDLSQRVQVKRRDEIGRISERFNMLADRLEPLITNLEDNVNERTTQLTQVNRQLEENRAQLKLLLDSTAEAIYGVDMIGNCTFCNASCVKLLGYSSDRELLGKNMHQLVTHTHADGSHYPQKDCRLMHSVRNAAAVISSSEVFWRKDGTSFPVEYRSHPQIIDGQVIGAVVTFLDITQRKLLDDEIKYQNDHDALTGLYNRRYFMAHRHVVDTQENLPLSLIFADINVLKITNDIYGHSAGDELIKKCAQALQEACGDNEAVIRMGGDEFLIFLPKKSLQEAERIRDQMREAIARVDIFAIQCSVSMGIGTKTEEKQLLDVVLATAENEMYKDKTLSRYTVNRELIDSIVERLFDKGVRERQHAQTVRNMCAVVGEALDLGVVDNNKLQRAAYLHDIGKITFDDQLLARDTLSCLTPEDIEVMRQHPVIGYRILNMFDDMLDIAEYVYSHHERWDGEGFPRRLIGEEIPLMSRIILVVETYDRIMHAPHMPESAREDVARRTIREGAGKQFDPGVASVFLALLEDNKLSFDA